MYHLGKVVAQEKDSDDDFVTPSTEKKKEALMGVYEIFQYRLTEKGITDEMLSDPKYVAIFLIMK